MSDHVVHIYARVPRFGGSWIACTECGEPHRGHETRSTLINERNALLVVKVATKNLIVDLEEAFPEGIDELDGVAPYVKAIQEALAALPENLK